MMTKAKPTKDELAQALRRNLLCRKAQLKARKQQQNGERNEHKTRSLDS